MKKIIIEMGKNYLLVICLVAVIFLGACNHSVDRTEIDNVDIKVEQLLSKMTLEEKVGQMNQYSISWDATGPAPSEGDAKSKYNHLKKGWVGSVLNVHGVKKIRELQKIAVEDSRLGIPLIFGFDVIHGYKTISPIPLAEAASWDMEAIKNSAEVAATEAAAAGINWTFAPMVDISRDARWGRVMEGAGEDPYLGAYIAKARIHGFQGGDLSAVNTIAACAKHFAAYAFAEAGREYNTVDIGTSTLYNIVFPPFKAAVNSDVKTFMNSFNIINGIPSTGSQFLQRDILKGEWGFDGFVVSDWASVKEMVNHGFAKDLKEAAKLAAIAGSDMDMESYAYVKHLVSLVEDKKVDEDLIDDAVRRILKVKYELGLFDDPYKYCNEQRESEMVYHKDHKKIVLDIAKKSIVLLKNEKSILPLQKNAKGIAVIGALAAEKNSPLGNWRIGSDDNTAVSVLEGLETYTTVNYAKGVDLITEPAKSSAELKINTTDKTEFAKAIALAKRSETVIMVLGEHGFQSGEGRSRTQLGLPGLQQELLEAIYKVNRNIVLVLMNGRPLTITWADENIPAIVEAWQLGSQSGNAIVQVLFGDYNPSGKLPMSFPRSVGQCPIYYNHYSTGRGMREENVFWSHYTDESNEPLYPFGYGLSYTEFKYDDLQIDTTNHENIKVSVNVINSGRVDGEEVVQLYVHDRTASVARPVKELKGFEKIKLLAGESKIISFFLTKNELGFYNNKGEFIVEPGIFDVMVGTNSEKGLSGNFDLETY